ncbi:hypothetical protein PSHT_14921 [Puccinia striiformis]|uniref:Uncharacterized protein n=1 Tax=Puccinia striiformis TaxID=27350 RepID=A0A2S4UI15_9BASI|nr:hypothetical protein PSHT_14921 [Puccinia striiformis]
MIFCIQSHGGAETGKKRHRHRPINRLYEYILATVIKAGQKSIIRPIQAQASSSNKKHSDLPDPLLQLGSLMKPSKASTSSNHSIFSLLSCNMDHITVKYNKAAN